MASVGSFVRRWLLGAAGRNGDGAPQEFRKICGCGGELACRRTATLQRLACPRCHAEFAVLPANPRPRPEALSRSGRKAFARWLRPRGVGDEEPAVVRPALPDGVAESESAAGELRQLLRPISTRWAAVRSRLRAWAAAASPRRWLTVPRALAVVVGLLVLATALGSLRSLQRARDRALLARAGGSGIHALQEGDFAAALRELVPAVEAADRLNRDDVDARRARQWRREAEAWSRLSLAPLEEWLAATADPTSAARKFQEDFSGRTVVIECSVLREESGNVQLLWEIAREATRAELELVDCRAFDVLPVGRPVNAVFAAELDRAALAAGDPACWQIRLAPQSVILLTEAAPLEHFGRTRDPQLTALLRVQRQMLGVEQ